MWHSKLLGTDAFPTTTLRLELPEEPTVPHWSKGLDTDQIQDQSDDQNLQIVDKLKLTNLKYLKNINNLMNMYVTLTNYGYFHVQGHKFYPKHFDYCVNKLCEIGLKDLNDFDGNVHCSGSPSFPSVQLLWSSSHS